jgi:hypothetical protein
VPESNPNIMCRNIRTLYNFQPPATDAEIEAAAVQYVRKLSGYNKPSALNTEAFAEAVAEIAAASKKLLASLVTNTPPKDRAAEAEKRRAQNRRRGF